MLHQQCELVHDDNSFVHMHTFMVILTVRVGLDGDTYFYFWDSYAYRYQTGNNTGVRKTTLLSLPDTP